MKIQITSLISCALAAWVSANVAVGAPLTYALNLTSSGPQFGTLDLGTGTFTNVGLTGVSPDTNTRCLGYGSNGALYAMFSTNSTTSLYTINPANGSATLIGDSTGVVATCAMTGSGTMYGAAFSGANLALYTVNLATGSPSLVGTMLPAPAGVVHVSLAAANNNLYLAAQPSGASTTLYAVNASTGAATSVGSTDAGVGGMAEVSGSLYAFTVDISGFSSIPAHIDVVSTASGAFSAGPNISVPAAYITGAVPAPLPYYFSDFVFGGGFQTTFTLINYSPLAVTCTTNFYSDPGGSLAVPFNQGAISTRTDVLPAGGSVHDQTISNLTAAVTEGWAQSTCSSPVQASLLYRYYVNGVAASEAGVNAETAPTTEFATFAQTATGVAYANPSITQSATITLEAYNATGTLLGSSIIALGPLQHGSANIGPLLGLASFTGFVKITSTVPIISLSLNAEAFPVISSLPPGDLPSSTNLVTP